MSVSASPGPLDFFQEFDTSVLGFQNSEISTFLQYQHAALEECSRQIKEQESIKSDYERLGHRLIPIAKETRAPGVVVPLGPHCVVRGELVHTNEILVFLGANHFVERTSAQALEIANRRITALDQRIAKLEEERKLLKDRLEMFASLAHQRGIEEVVEIRERIDESSGEGGQKAATDEQLRKRLDELEEEEIGELQNDFQELMVEDMEIVEEDSFKRPLPPPNARPRRSSLPSGETRKSSRKNVTFILEEGMVPERENRDNTMFKQALKRFLVGTKFKSMDESGDSDEWSMQGQSGPRDPVLAIPPKLKKQEHISSMDIDVEPISDSDTIMERNIGSFESPPVSHDTASITEPYQKPVSRFKAKRMEKDS